jgi:hypothetical protein
MNTRFSVTGNALTIRAALIVLTVLLVSWGSPVFGQTDYDDKIEDLEKALEEIKASIRQGEDVGARVEALEEELAKLKEDIAEGEPSGEEAEDQVAAAAPADQHPPAGVQGAPNPMQDDKKYLTGQDLLDESFPNSIGIPGSQVRFRIGGYAKLDFIQDLDYVGDRYEFEIATIPVEGTPEAALDGRTTAHAKQTRLNFDFRSQAHNKKWNKDFPLQAFLEIDFFEDREDLARQPRLRHAYGVVGRFLAGQTWNISSDLEALPGTIDFSGGDALYGDRVAQIRWQDSAGESMTWAIGPRIRRAISAIHSIWMAGIGRRCRTWPARCGGRRRRAPTFRCRETCSSSTGREGTRGRATRRPALASTSAPDGCSARAATTRSWAVGASARDRRTGLSPSRAPAAMR